MKDNFFDAVREYFGGNYVKSWTIFKSEYRKREYNQFDKTNLLLNPLLIELQDEIEVSIERESMAEVKLEAFNRRLKALHNLFALWNNLCPSNEGPQDEVDYKKIEYGLNNINKIIWFNPCEPLPRMLRAILRNDNRIIFAELELIEQLPNFIADFTNFNIFIESLMVKYNYSEVETELFADDVASILAFQVSESISLQINDRELGWEKDIFVDDYKYNENY